MSKKSVNYIDKAKFSQEVYNYVLHRKECESKGLDIPVVPDYIANCFVKLCEGLASRPNFSGYTYRDEMIGDGIENCLKAIPNYDIASETQSGKPNAFGYFTKCVWWCFLRRIQKEKKQAEIRNKYIMSSGVDMMSIVDMNDKAHLASVQNYVSNLRGLMDEHVPKNKEDSPQ